MKDLKDFLIKDHSVKRHWLLILLLVVMSNKVNADDEGFYLGFGLSQNSYKYAGQSYEGAGGNWYFGYKFNPTISFQFEMGLGGADGDEESMLGDYVGFYGAYRSPGEVYLIAKAGLNFVYLSSAENEVTTFSGGSSSTVTIKSESENSSGLGVGFGVGAKFTPSFRLEAGLTHQDTSMQTIGLNLLYIF